VLSERHHDASAAHLPRPVRSVGRRRRLRRTLLAAIPLLYAFSIPWYRGAESELRLWWGFPDWVAAALACYVAIAVLNYAAWQLTEIPEPDLEERRAGQRKRT
jgi:hypothetical protein